MKLRVFLACLLMAAALPFVATSCGDDKYQLEKDAAEAVEKADKAASDALKSLEK